MNTSTNHPILEAMAERRSIRKYTDTPVTAEQLETILEAGRWAPSGLNNQPWRFLVVRSDDPRMKQLEEHTKYSHVVRGCQALICVFLDRERKYHDMKDYQGAGACIQNMLMATHALNLGAVWLGEIVAQADGVMNTLGLDNTKYEFMAAIALGEPAANGSSSRLELAELMLEIL